jgi:DNA-binding winged helix-turn-helix (wHTH) protein
MTSLENPVQGYLFDDWQMDLENRSLAQAGVHRPLNSRYFDVLAMLLSRAGRLVTKQQIFEQVWGEVIVSDSALSQCIKELRRLLGDPAGEPRYIRTVAKQGFVFIAPVRALEKSHPFLPQRPYKFLDFFTEEDAAIFFGRESESELLASKILTSRTFLLYGRSGVGKSSIVRAGVAPLLKQRGYPVKVIAGGRDPLSLATSDRLRMSEGTVLFWDQFEDFFLHLAEEQQAEVLAVITPLLAPPLNIRIVFILREDMLAEMNRLKSLIPDIFHHEFRLTRLSREQARAAIAKPAHLVGCPMEASLCERILDDMEAEDLYPPQLQIICDVLYDERHPDLGMTLREYARQGGAAKILAHYLNRVLNRFPAAELLQAKTILKQLLGPDNRRQALPLEQLFALFDADERDAIAGLIEELARARILRFTRSEGVRWLELSHEYLVAEISGWVSEEEQTVKKMRALLHRGMENYALHGLLLSRETVALIAPHAEFLELTIAEMQLLAASSLQKGIPVQWHCGRDPEPLLSLIGEASEDRDAQVRLAAVASAEHLASPEVQPWLTRLALWDGELKVRKEASLALVKLFGKKGTTLLTGREQAGRPGLFRRAVSLALVRDDAKQRVHLSRLPALLTLLILAVLIGIRLWRHRGIMLRKIILASTAAAIYGVLLGIVLGLLLSWTSETMAYQAMIHTLVLISLGMIAGLLAGLGVSSGTVIVSEIAYRHSRYWIVAGGALGGAIIGGVVYFFGHGLFTTLFGKPIPGMAGALEGLVLGAGLGFGRVLFKTDSAGFQIKRVWGAALGGMVSALMLFFLQRNLISGSIVMITSAFAEPQIHLKPLALLFGETGPAILFYAGLSALEGFWFGSLLSAGMELAGASKNAQPG